MAPTVGDIVAWLYVSPQGAQRQVGMVHAVAHRETPTLPAGTLYVRMATSRTPLPKQPDDVVLLWTAAEFDELAADRLRAVAPTP